MYDYAIGTLLWKASRILWSSLLEEIMMLQHCERWISFWHFHHFKWMSSCFTGLKECNIVGIDVGIAFYLSTLECWQEPGATKSHDKPVTVMELLQLGLLQQIGLDVIRKLLILTSVWKRANIIQVLDLLDRSMPVFMSTSLVLRKIIIWWGISHWLGSAQIPSRARTETLRSQ